MKTLTDDLYTIARKWLRFDGFDPYNTAPRITDNMSEARYQRERASFADVTEWRTAREMGMRS